MTPAPESPKSFWSRKESIPAIIFWAACAAAGIWFWGIILPFLLSAAIDTLHLMIVGGTIAALLMLVTSKKVHIIGRSISRMITGWFVAIDPIGIRKTYIEETQKKKSQLDDSINTIRGLRIELVRRLNSNKTSYSQAMSLLQGANSAFNDPRSDEERKRQAQRMITFQSRSSERLAKLIDKQTANLDRYDMIIKVLARYGEVCDDTIQDLQQQVDIQEQELRESKASQKGMRAAFGILRGFGQEKEMDNMATAEIEKQYGEQMGEVEGLLDLTKNVMSTADFNDEASLASVKQKLDDWSAKNSTLQIGRGGISKQQLLSNAGAVTVAAPRDVAPVGEDYFK